MFCTTKYKWQIVTKKYEGIMWEIIVKCNSCDEVNDYMSIEMAKDILQSSKAV